MCASARIIDIYIILYISKSLHACVKLGVPSSVVVKTLVCHHYNERFCVQVSSEDTLCM